MFAFSRCGLQWTNCNIWLWWTSFLRVIECDTKHLSQCKHKAFKWEAYQKVMAHIGVGDQTSSVPLHSHSQTFPTCHSYRMLKWMHTKPEIANTSSPQGEYSNSMNGGSREPHHISQHTAMQSNNHFSKLNHKKPNRVQNLWLHEVKHITY